MCTCDAQRAADFVFESVSLDRLQHTEVSTQMEAVGKFSLFSVRWPSLPLGEFPGLGFA